MIMKNPVIIATFIITYAFRYIVLDIYLLSTKLMKVDNELKNSKDNMYEQKKIKYLDQLSEYANSRNLAIVDTLKNINIYTNSTQVHIFYIHLLY